MRVNHKANPPGAHLTAWQFGLFALAVHIHCSAAISFNVFGPCEGEQQHGGSTPQCRRQQGSPAGQQTVAVSALPQQLPVDIRLPCEIDSLECHQNVDVVNIPQPPRAPDVANCSYELMPWSPFPCSYDSVSSYGIPGQPTSLCYTTPLPGFSSSPARNLTTDGYNTAYFGVLPNSFCSAGSKVYKMLLTLDFRLAAGRQFDRTYSFQIGRAVAAFGTCSEPSRLVQSDKYWSVTVDVTHLQNYMQPGMDTRFSLANVLTNTYNVPIWAKATLNVYYQLVVPSRKLLSYRTKPAAAAATAAASSGMLQTMSDMPSNMLQEGRQARAADVSGLNPLQSADVPTEVLPLTPPDSISFDSLISIAGNSDNPVSWPNVTYQLPASLSAAGTIYRAQLLVVPKANGCEEFWAMNPPSSVTNTTCGDVSTGDPYREVRVHVNGELAGFYPIYYTMYTGGVDPRLWTAIVPSYAYSLPVYTFDLGPWLGLLNTPTDSDPDNPHTITVEILGASGSDWILANTLLIWRSSDPDQIVTALIEPWTASMPGSRDDVVTSCDGKNITEAGTCVTEVAARTLVAESILQAGNSIWVSFVKYQLSRHSNVITFNNTDGTASWAQRTSHKAAWFTGLKDSAALSALARAAKPDKRASAAAPASAVTCSCSHQVRGDQGGRRLMDLQGKRPLPSKPVKGPVKPPGRMWDGRSGDKGSVITQNARIYDWVMVGGQYDMAPYIFSFNETLQVPTVFANPETLGAAPGVVTTGRQTHYQQATMVNVYNTSQPACSVPSETTHSVFLNHSIGRGSGKSVPRKACKAWNATCAFCAPGLLLNDLNVSDCPS